MTPSEWSEEVRQGDFECKGQSRESCDPDVAFPAFDATDVIAVKIGAGGQLLLGDLQIPPQFANSAPDGGGKVTSHNRNRARLNTIGLHTIVFILDIGLRSDEQQAATEVCVRTLNWFL